LLTDDGMSRRLFGLCAGAVILACSSPTQSPTPGTGGDGASGTSGSAGTTGSAGSGAGGSNAAQLVACAGTAVDNANPGAIANPGDFSINTDTNHQDEHSLWMGRADMVRRVLTYTTAGPADHKHEVVLTDAQLNALLAGTTITVSTSGPPLNAATGHSHMITVRPCGITPGFGGAGGGAATTAGAAGTSGTTTAATLIDCAGAGGPGAIANPADFSVNPDTGSLDMHLLSMSRGDLSRGQSQYKTGGPADHQHEIFVTFEERQLLTSGQSIVVNTAGPPLNAPSGHGHTIKISACPNP
jgi:hypothetical protein